MAKKIQIPTSIPVKEDQGDTDPLIGNCQPIAMKKLDDIPKNDEKNKHQLPSSLIVLTEKEKVLIQNALFEESLERVGLV